MPNRRTWAYPCLIILLIVLALGSGVVEQALQNDDHGARAACFPARDERSGTYLKVAIPIPMFQLSTLVGGPRLPGEPGGGAKCTRRGEVVRREICEAGERGSRPGECR